MTIYAHMNKLHWKRGREVAKRSSLIRTDRI
uniref:Uncharacterized protein n=1 Tax=Anguilla anguilla TaxID=7936 RepID=A0A0E9SLU3_ANGAN